MYWRPERRAFLKCWKHSPILAFQGKWSTAEELFKQQTTRTTLHQNPSRRTRTRGQGLAALQWTSHHPCSLQCKECRQSFCLGAHFVVMFVYRCVPTVVLKFLLWTGKYQYENSPFFFASSLHFFLVFAYNNFLKKLSILFIPAEATCIRKHKPQLALPHTP